MNLNTLNAGGNILLKKFFYSSIIFFVLLIGYTNIFAEGPVINPGNETGEWEIV
jgi:hypothetical protein